MRHDSRASFLALNLASPCLGCEPKARVAIINANEKEFKLIQKLDMQDMKNIGMRELINFDPYTKKIY